MDDMKGEEDGIEPQLRGCEISQMLPAVKSSAIKMQRYNSTAVPNLSRVKQVYDYDNFHGICTEAANCLIVHPQAIVER
jgi:hypothetical protein